MDGRPGNGTAQRNLKLGAWLDNHVHRWANAQPRREPLWHYGFVLAGPVDFGTQVLTMTVKQNVVSELGDQELLASDLIAQSLMANDQIKYYFALLQTARDNAEKPQVPAPDLKTERVASQVDDEWLDDVVSGTRKIKSGVYRVPHGPELLRRIKSGIEAMHACLPDVDRAPFLARLAKLKFPAVDHGAISSNLIAAITSGNRKAADSLHLVVMDTHRAINLLQAKTAVEIVSGARAHRLSETGRQRVQAFMDGLNRTAPLKFDHPGLGTTATEHNGQLLVQNVSARPMPTCWWCASGT
jgi:hypothetical protein